MMAAVAAPLAAQDGVPLVTAAAERDGAAVRALVAAGAGVNAARADGATALLYAAHWDDLESADLLLRAGARWTPPTTTASRRWRAPARTSVSGWSSCCWQRAPDPNAAQASGLTPLMTAVRTGSVEVVRALLEAGADVNAATVETRSTPLMWAVAGQRRDLAHRLIERGADVHVSTAKGFTLLMMAARSGDIEMARTLLAAGAGVNAPSADGTHVLPFAIVLGQDEFAYFLLEQGADPNGAVAGVSALHAATGHMVFWLAEWHQKHGASSRGRDSRRPSGRRWSRRCWTAAPTPTRASTPRPCSRTTSDIPAGAPSTRTLPASATRAAPRRSG